MYVTGRRVPGLRRLGHDAAGGITRAIREAIPEVTEVVDTTDHSMGRTPTIREVVGEGPGGVFAGRNVAGLSITTCDRRHLAQLW